MGLSSAGQTSKHYEDRIGGRLIGVRQALFHLGDVSV
jgi:hypothetical protein